ncbi:hypothetical protein MMC16_000744 [Acarospora aff. strigata]|nr:hypothetical protein [Acarospora aff. strigata]
MPLKAAIASMSLGRAWVHNLPEKLDQAAAYGMAGVEIFYEDLEYLAKAQSGGQLTVDNQLAAARIIRNLCDERHLTIIGLQPFLFYEGLVDRKEHEAKIEQLKVWFQLVKILGTDVIQIPTNFLQEGITGDVDTIVKDMIEVADMGLQEKPIIKFAYENLAWGTFIDTWEAVWDIVTEVDRPNFGMCLDTFNIAGRVWADPSSPSGKTPNADADLQASIAAMIKTVDVNKIFYVQVVDAERMQTPLGESHPFHVDGQPSRMSWSRNARLFAFEEARGAYLPTLEVAKAFTAPQPKGLGFDGWVSMELFSRTMAEKDPSVPREHARRAAESWEKLSKELGCAGK